MNKELYLKNICVGVYTYMNPNNSEYKKQMFITQGRFDLYRTTSRHQSTNERIRIVLKLLQISIPFEILLIHQRRKLLLLFLKLI